MFRSKPTRSRLLKQLVLCVLAFASPATAFAQVNPPVTSDSAGPATPTPAVPATPVPSDAGPASNAAPAPVPGAIPVDITVAGSRAATVTAHLFRPEGAQPTPAVLMLHGCGGIYNRSGRLTARERDWISRFLAKGYAVLLLDSFTARGVSQVCTLSAKDRPVWPRQRARDAAAAMRWLQAQPFIDKSRIAVIGWSHGGSSTLWTASEVESFAASDRPKAAIAFYPGCRLSLERDDYKPSIPVTILIGSADDWTPPEPCRELAARHGMALTEYPGAVHGFDNPSTPRRTRTGVAISARGDGRVEIGTDPAARAASIDVVMNVLATAFAGSGR